MQNTGIIRSFLFLLSVCYFLGQLNSQHQYLTSPGITATGNPPGCLTDILMQQKLATNPSLAARIALMNQDILDQHGNLERSVLTIPVVVHVIHMNGPENISSEQILNGIQHLNDAFANAGAFSDASGVNTEIRFCLAVQDPDGGFTGGVTYTVSELTNVNAETQDADLKSLIRWDPNRYLNIWLVKEITSTSMGSGVAGYAYFPTSQGQPEDGIVNEAHLFGSSSDNSKVHIHEAGHYLGLYHTFEGGCSNTNCQTDGDHVCDTPPDNSTAAVNCSATPNTCNSDADDLSANNPFRPVANGGIGDQPDLFKDYMDYGFQACQTYFTPGQSARMIAALTTTRSILLESNGCVSPCLFPTYVLSLTADTTAINSGATVNFTAVISASNTDSIKWTVNAVDFPTNSTEFSHLFSTPGTYVVTITVFNQQSLGCESSRSITIDVLCPAQASFQLSPNNSYNPGEQISTVNTSINSTFYQWNLDGNTITSPQNWQQTFAIPGGHSLYLIAGNAECSDTSSTKFFQIGGCDFSEVTNHWVLQDMNLDFTNGNPVTNIYSPYDVGIEASSAISDANGNLLFFSDGLHAWDRNFQLMPNGSGLLGHLSCSQGVLITPHPGNPSQYFLFTNSAIEDTNHIGLHYSIVDMTLNGGMGDVVPSAKNISLLTYTSEKLSATWHANGRDIWVATSTTIDESWYSFLIDNEGVHAEPIVSNVGILCEVGLGGMRFSHDGNRMAAPLVCQWPWRISLFDFNKATGQFSNPIHLMLSSIENIQIFSVEFSPDNSKLYASTWQGSDILQYDLENTTGSAIMNSLAIVDPYESGFFGQLLCRDGKMYVSVNTIVDVINFPNLPGAACGYESNFIPSDQTHLPGIPLNNTLNGYEAAHPPLITGPFNVCKGGIPFEYGITFESAEDSSVWSHSGPGTLIAQNGINSATIISSENVGIDTLRVTVYGSCGITHDTIIINTNNPEITSLPDEVSFCTEPVLLSPGDGFLSYEWQNDTYANSLQANETGLYWVRVKGHSGCFITDSVNIINAQPLTPVSLGSDRVICQGQTTTINAGDYEAYQWHDGSENNSFTAYLAGLYWVTVFDGCYSSTDTIMVSETITDLHLNYTGKDSVCKTALPFVLSAPSGFESYLWANGLSTQNINISAIGVYSVTAATAQGCYGRDTVWVIDCLSLEDISEFTSYRYYPNPANNQLTIEAITENNLLVKVYAVSGQLLLDDNVQGKNKLIISTLEYAAGLYIIEVQSDGRTSHQKLVISH